MNELTIKERNTTALALFSLGMRYGPPLFETIENIVKKLDLEKGFVDYAKDWIDHPKEKDI